MILIADSGSTKTTWALSDKETAPITVKTNGINPYFITEESIEKIIRDELVPLIAPDSFDKVYFYGAGCSTENNNRKLINIMARYYPAATVEIYHDILGAARALFGKDKGIAAILGTGCNSCYYNGEEIFSNVPSLGYLYGDEGAGSNLGKTFLGFYLKKKLPADISAAFDQQYHFTLEDILNSIYNRPAPNRFLASLSTFIAPRQQHPFLHDLVKASFISFFEEQIEKYENYKEVPVSFVGSIAWYYRDILMEAALEQKISVGTILQSPLEGLVRYHAREIGH
ncbi:MAG: ATPase [Bacteroidetes bacterium]|nr:ATPase [Bacteroidota bacterium]